MTGYKYEFDDDELHHIIFSLKGDLEFYKSQLKEHKKKKEYDDIETVEGFIHDYKALIKKMGRDPWTR